MRQAGLDVWHLPLAMTDKIKWWRYRRAQRELRRLLFELRPDVIHANDLPTSQMVAQAAGRLGVPRVCHHRWIFEGPAIDWLNKFGAERHLFVSHALMNQLCAASPRLATIPREVVHDGLPLPACPGEAERFAARSRLGLPADRLVALYAGQIIPRKGVADLLNAWHALHAAWGERAELVLVGDDLENDGHYRREMEALAAQLGCGARFVGFQRNVPQWLTAADVCLVPSHAEPLGNATLEAMAHGRPVIGTQVGGIPEMVVDGETGLLVPPHDPPRLAAAIDRLLGDAGQRAGWRRRAAAVRAAVFALRACRGDGPAIPLRGPRPGGGGRMTRTLVLARVFPPQVGGSGRFLWEIYRRQAPAEFQIAAGEYAGSDVFDRDAGLSIHRLPLDVASWGLLPWGFPSYASNFRRILRIVRAQRIGALHAATLLPEGLLAWMVKRWAGLPYLSFVHGEEIPIVAGSRELAWLVRRVLDGASAIIANSENTRRDCAAWPDVDGKLTVITPGVAVERFCPAAHDPHVRERLGWTGRRVVLTAGRLQERKGHDCLIRALPAIRRAIPDALYAIVGDGERRAVPGIARRRLWRARRGEVPRQPGRSRPDRVLPAMRSVRAAQPRGGRRLRGLRHGPGRSPGLRAARAGWNIGGHSGNIGPGESGRLVNCERPEPLAQALIEMLNDPKGLERMGAAARQWAVDRFDWGTLAGRAQALFAELGPGGGDVPAGAKEVKPTGVNVHPAAACSNSS